MEKEWLILARQSLENAKRELIYSALAFEKSGVAFKDTVKVIKEDAEELARCIDMLKDKGF